MISRQTFASLNTQQNKNLFYQIVGILAAIAALWAIIAGILSFFPAWLIILVTLILGAVWLLRWMKEQRRQQRIDFGFCAQCGYDLRATPKICPECGRDASLDEPTWKKVRRNFAARLAAEAKSVVPVLPIPDSPEPVPTPMSVPRLKNVVIRRPDVDDGPIPLEPSPDAIESLSQFPRDP